MNLFKLVTVVLFGVLYTGTALGKEQMFSGTPTYANEEAKALVEEMIKAHGGAEAWADVEALQFSIITKLFFQGNQNPQPPRYSVETVNLETGAAYLDWPYWGAEIVYDGKEVKSKNWPIPLPPGFFAHLTFSFLTLPWQTQTDGVSIGEVREETLPERDKASLVVRMTHEAPNPNIPGQFFDLFINPETKLVEGLKFNITHPGMMAVDAQPIGPNYHIFIEHMKVGDALIPAYYESFGTGAGNNVDVGAIHIIYEVSAGEVFDSERLEAAEGFTIDTQTTNWWGGKDGE